MPQQIELRKTIDTDLAFLFLFQLDKEANYMAAFTANNTGNKEAYFEKYLKIIGDPEKNMQTIFCNGQIIGSVSKYEIEGEAEITYWIDKQYWGQGIGTKALSSFLAIEKMRPIFGRVAFDNLASKKVLENCGFKQIGTDKGFANARNAEIEELIFKLDN
jgi:[ribosomal protein S5]-alanine N-acetyltransferase